MFTCAAVGNPLPNIIWSISGVDISLTNIATFDEEELHSASSSGSGIGSTSTSGFGSGSEKSNDIFSVHTSRVLNELTVISRLRFSETAPHLADDYECVASNIIGNKSTTATLIVHGEFNVLMILPRLIMCLYVSGFLITQLPCTLTQNLQE